MAHVQKSEWNQRCNDTTDRETLTMQSGQSPANVRAPACVPESGNELAISDNLRKPMGTWATGRRDYVPGNELTGLDPVVDLYSITRLGSNKWETRNESLLRESNDKIRDAELVKNCGKRRLRKIYEEIDRFGSEATDHLKARGCEVRQWKANLEDVITSVAREVQLLETEGRRVKQSLSVLTIPESIAGEYLQLRACRLEPDLVRDDIEEELAKEVALCSEIRDVFCRLRERIETLLTGLRNLKIRLENDWSDKKNTVEVETASVGLTIDSPLIMWKSGVDRFPAEQSTPSDYANFARQLLTEGETTRDKSVSLRSIVNGTYDDAIRALRNQATRVDVAVARKIHLTETILSKLEKELLKCLRELANTEEHIEELRRSTVKLDRTTKLAQTRLDERLLRRNVENCRDSAQLALLEQVKAVSNGTCAVSNELERSKNARTDLLRTRCCLENEIMVKRKSLYVDKERGKSLRSLYPTTDALLGYQ